MGRYSLGGGRTVGFVQVLAAEMMLTPEVREFLFTLGKSEERIRGLTMQSQMVRDLQIVGDTLFEDMETLASKFAVDMSSFDYTKHIPLEHTSDAYHLGRRPWFFKSSWQRKVDRILLKYDPITLQMIHDSIVAKRWSVEA